MILENPQPILNKKKCRVRRPRRWIRNYCIRCPCVLYWNNQPVPLKKVKYDVAINGGMANVTLSQEYFNNNTVPINLSYKFPVNESVVFGGMEAIFKNRRVQGKIKQKDQAKAEFNMHKALGNTVAYAEQIEETEDIMKVELGNFPPNEPLTISFKYLVTLDVINEVNWGFRIPATLTPRYNPSGASAAKYYSGGNPRWLSCPMFTDTRFVTSERYPWEININIAWPGGAKKVHSLSHMGEMLVTQQPGMINVKMNPTVGLQYPNKDFELVIEDQNLFSNNCQVAMTDMPTLTGGSPKYAALMQFVPAMYKWYADKGIDDSQGIDLYAEDNEDFLLEKTKAEFIFILDRSGSMRGTRMDKAKNALIFFLKSLPMKSRFNIISFGTSFEKMYPQSVEYNSNNLNITIQRLNSFAANMGGTNILGPIQSAFSLPRILNYQRNIFLLTDGAVSNTTEVFNSIEINSLYNAARVFSIGIGNGCSELLVKRSARLGNGRSVIIADNDNVEGKVVTLLNDSLTPSLTNFSVEFDEKYICAIAPQPSQNSHIIRGEPFTMFALIKNDIETAPNMSTQVKINFYDGVEERMESRVFNLSLNGCIQDNSFHKMAVKKVIENLGAKKIVSSAYLDPKLAAVPEIFTKLAIAYQVLSSEHTAFICVIEENNNGIFQPTANVIVPSLESVDYNNNQGSMYGVARAKGMARSYRGGSRGRGGRPMYRAKKKKMSSGYRGGGSRGGGFRGGPGTNAPMAYNNSLSRMAAPKMKMKKKSRISELQKRNKTFSDKPQQLFRSLKVNEEECDDLDHKEDFMALEKSNRDALTSKSDSNSVAFQQDITGFWAYSPSLFTSMGTTENSFNALKSQITDLNTLMTVIVLAWLEMKADQTSVAMILRKGMRFLRTQNLSNYKELISEAKTYF